MTYFSDNLSLVADSLDNINLFMLSDRKIFQHYFQKELNSMNKKIIAEEVFLEYNTSIDDEDNIYLVYQNMSLDLILIILKGEKTQIIGLKDKLIGEVYYLDIIIHNHKPHIFYFQSLVASEKQYGLYHHYFNGVDWTTKIVDKINVDKILNPMRIINNGKELIVAYYDKIKDEQIYMKTFSLEKEEWEDKIQLTTGINSKLYVDILLKEDKLNLVYSQFKEGNLIIKYERFNYKNKIVEKEKILSNIDNPQDPILIYYDEKLWIAWIEYDCVISRYSVDYGNTWSPMYLWNESKEEDIVKYKFYKMSKLGKNILNYSFGKINPDIRLIGFGSLDGAREMDIKKQAP